MLYLAAAALMWGVWTAPVDAVDGPCAPGQGATVVVDPGVGHTAQVRCVVGGADSGLAALRRAGMDYSFRPGFPGMICQLDGLPEECNGAPAEAYWSFWDVREDQWVYAVRGAGSAPAEIDSVLGWAFGPGQAPRAGPPEPATAQAVNPVAEQGTASGKPGPQGPTPGAATGLAVALVGGAAAWTIARRRHV